MKRYLARKGCAGTLIAFKPAARALRFPGCSLGVSLLLLVGCGQPPTHVKVIVGAQLPSQGIEYSVVVVEGNTIRAAGRQSDIPVPKGAEITSGLGKILEPEPGATVDAGQPATLRLRDAKDPSIEARMQEGVWK